MIRLTSFRKTKLFFALAIILILGASFVFGVWYGYSERPGAEKVLNIVGQELPPQLQNVDFNLFWDVWSRLEEKYVDKEKLDRKDLVRGAIAGLVRSLKDPYTEFLPPPETKQFQEDVKGSFEGIGAEIGIRRGTLTMETLPSGPASRPEIKS